VTETVEDGERLRGALVIGLADRPSLNRLNERLKDFGIEVRRTIQGSGAISFEVLYRQIAFGPRALDSWTDFTGLIEAAAASSDKPSVREKEKVINRCLQVCLATPGEREEMTRKVNRYGGAYGGMRADEMLSTRYAMRVSDAVRGGVVPLWEEIDRRILEMADHAELETAKHLTLTRSPAVYEKWDENAGRGLAVQKAGKLDREDHEREDPAGHERGGRRANEDGPSRSREGVPSRSRSR
jgi:hypothetical protein